MATTPGLGDIWLFCAMAEQLLGMRDSGWTYKRLAKHIKKATDQVARQHLWKAQATSVNLRRCVLWLNAHFRQDLLIEGEDNELLTPA
jgi:hypothetical protein